METANGKHTTTGLSPTKPLPNEDSSDQEQKRNDNDNDKDNEKVEQNQPNLTISANLSNDAETEAETEAEAEAETEVEVELPVETKEGPPRALFYLLDLPLLYSSITTGASDHPDEAHSSIRFQSLLGKVVALTPVVFRKVDFANEEREGESILRLNLHKLQEAYEAHAPNLEAVLLWIDYGGLGGCDVEDEEVVAFMRKNFPKFGVTPRQQVLRGQCNETVECVLNEVAGLMTGSERSPKVNMESFRWFAFVDSKGRLHDKLASTVFHLTYTLPVLLPGGND